MRTITILGVVYCRGCGIYVGRATNEHTAYRATQHGELCDRQARYLNPGQSVGLFAAGCA